MAHIGVIRWLKENGYRADQVQAFLPGPMATATAMYHTGKNPLRRVTRESEDVIVPKGLKVRRLHKAFLRYHDANNWPMLRDALKRMGREDLIGSGNGIESADFASLCLKAAKKAVRLSAFQSSTRSQAP